MIQLYHGSNVRIVDINLSFGRKGKDFGQGFYLSDDLSQAEKMAQLVTMREESGIPTVSTFLFDDSCMTNGRLSIKQFDSYSVEWADFVVSNRSNTGFKHSFDIVYGPIANDAVGVQIRRFMLNYIDINRLVEELKYITPTFQYYFGTIASLSYLKSLK